MLVGSTHGSPPAFHSVTGVEVPSTRNVVVAPGAMLVTSTTMFEVGRAGAFANKVCTAANAAGNCAACAKNGV